MSVFRKIGIVGVSTGGRLVGTLLMYSLLARGFGPTQFGEFGYWYSIGIMLAALSDYGFGQQILTTFSTHEHDSIRDDAARLLQGKLVLMLVLFSGGALVALFTSTSSEWLWIILLLGACAVSTLFDFFGWMLKARGAFSADSARALLLSLVGNALAGAVGITTGNLAWACASLLLIRGALLVSQYRVVARLTTLHWRDVLVRRRGGIWQTLRGGSMFAADSAAVQGFSNVDVLVAKNVLDGHSAGLYLAGSRLAQAALAGIPVLASVYIPQLSRAAEGLKLALPRSLVALAAIAGVGVGAVFLIGQRELPRMLFGDEFAELSPLMAVFGGAVAIRYLAAVPGTLLSATRLQKMRALVHFFGFVCFLAVFGLFYVISGPESLDAHVFVFAFAMLGIFQLAGFSLCWYGRMLRWGRQP